MDYAAITTEQALTELASSAEGLTPSEARQRARAYGSNRLQEAAGEPLWRRLVEPFRSLFVIVLLVAAGLSVGTERTQGS
jgi:magnesium-transporting ATPase (P-type)